ncbi:DNA polymerase beta superfamily protein [Halalkalibacter oceani]|uniref:DNA polymerase beta superfamily protein n=1 Tax=Halalkalibacter oceani TaxID=1653776 RepID=UPI00339B9432
MERTIAFKALVGSHNYNLNTPDSDKDYKVFVIPTFDDLYKGNRYSKSVVTDTHDYDYHDIRQLSNLFWRSNINFIEVLYSNEIIHSEDIKIKRHIEKIFKLKDEIVKMNLPYLFKACQGMNITKMKSLLKGTQGTKHLVEKYGYDTKAALHAYRVLDFIMRFADSEFKDFKQAIEYRDKARAFMIGIKNGAYSFSCFQDLIAAKLEAFEEYEQYYFSQQPQEFIKEELELITYELVRDSIKNHGDRERIYYGK